jgi:hypothetical protein
LSDSRLSRDLLQLTAESAVGFVTDDLASLLAAGAESLCQRSIENLSFISFALHTRHMYICEKPYHIEYRQSCTVPVKRKTTQHAEIFDHHMLKKVIYICYRVPTISQNRIL